MYDPTREAASVARSRRPFLPDPTDPPTDPLAGLRRPIGVEALSAGRGFADSPAGAVEALRAALRRDGLTADLRDADARRIGPGEYVVTRLAPYPIGAVVYPVLGVAERTY